MNRLIPNWCGAALEDLLRKGALHWVGLDGNNVQVLANGGYHPGT
jgi:hypothetical protein